MMDGREMDRKFGILKAEQQFIDAILPMLGLAGTRRVARFAEWQIERVLGIKHKLKVPNE